MVDMTRDGKLHLEASNFIIGHASPGVRSLYGNGMSMAPLKEEIDRIKPPVDLVALLVEAQEGKIDMTDTISQSDPQTAKPPVRTKKLRDEAG
jgi:hypothetical protein